MIRIKGRFLNYAEVWSADMSPVSGADVVYRFRAPQPLPGHSSTQYHTLLIDLTRADDDIFKDFQRTTRAQIRRAQTEDEITYEIHTEVTNEQLVDYVDAYCAFATERSLEPLSFDYLRYHVSAGSVVISIVRYRDEPLVRHLYIVDTDRAVLYRSSSSLNSADHDMRKLIGRANRLQTWNDIQHFKRAGLVTFDFCGWYEGGTDEALLGVNRFKACFGGQKAVAYKVVEVVSWKARVLRGLCLLRWWGSSAVFRAVWSLSGSWRE
jgi:hypothetical protein